MTPAEAKTQRAIRSSIAASLTFEARQKDHEAACWLGLARNMAANA
jgi:predicted transcriptional regulator